MKEYPLDLSLFDFRWKVGFIRYSLISIFCLIIAHLSADLIPFSAGYNFPTQKFIGLLIFGVVVCTTSWVVTNLFRGQIFEEGTVDIKTFKKFISYNVVGCFLMYSLLFVALSLPHFNLNKYLIFLLISLGVVVIENLVFLLIVTYRSKIRRSNNHSSYLLVPLASRQVRVDYQDISYAKIDAGIVTVYPYEGKPISTHYSTLDQLQKNLPPDIFYRANRQYIISKDAVEQLVRGANRKLTVRIRGQQTIKDIVVSRYKRRDLQTWLGA